METVKSINNQDGVPRHMNNHVIRLPQVCSITGLARSTIYKLASEGSFPTPIKLTPRSSGWLESEVVGWITERIESSRKEETH